LRDTEKFRLGVFREENSRLLNPNVSSLGDWSIPAKHEKLLRHRLVV
jgi:hypothetical protein